MRKLRQNHEGRPGCVGKATDDSGVLGGTTLGQQGWIVEEREFAEMDGARVTGRAPRVIG